MKNIEKNALFTEISEKEAASVSGGGWQQWWDGTRNTRNAVSLSFKILTGSVLLPVGVATSIIEKKYLSPPKGPIA